MVDSLIIPLSTPETHTMLTAYPLTWKDAADVLIDKLPGIIVGGDTTGLPRVTHALWDASGYLLRKTYPDNEDANPTTAAVKPVKATVRSLRACGATELTAEQLVERLKIARGHECPDLSGFEAGVTPGPLSATDWQSILLTMLELLLRFLK